MSKKSEIEKEFMELAKSKYRARYDCKPGFKRCVNCAKVSAAELFTSRSNWCKKCTVIRMVAYRLKREDKIFAETGARPHKRAGRPLGTKNKIKPQTQ